MSIRNWNIDSPEELKAWRDNLFLDDTDVEHIAQKYNQNFEEIKRVKEYLFRNDDLLDAVNAKMWGLAKSGEMHPSVTNFISHEIIQSGKMQRENISFLDTSSRDAAWRRLHTETLVEQNLPPEALFHPDVIAQHASEFSSRYHNYWK